VVTALHPGAAEAPSAAGAVGVASSPAVASGRAARLAAVLEAPPEGEIAAADLAGLVDDLSRALQGLAGELPAEERLVVDAFMVRTARRHPDRLASTGDGFVANPRTCRRAIGIVAAARCARGLAPGPQTAVAEVLAAALETDGAGAVAPSPWWAPWYRTLTPGGRAVVAAEATTWATQMLTVLDWRALDAAVAIGGRDDWWQCPGPRSVALRGRAEARLLVGRRPVLFVMGAGSCGEDWRPQLAFPALVSALGRAAPAAPCRVVGVWPQSGQVRVMAVDAGVLRGAADIVVAAAATWVDARLDALGPPTA
jgi:hypothetical protein